MIFKLMTFAHDNNGMWPNAYLAEKIATLNYLKNGFTKDEIINFRKNDIIELINNYPEHFEKDAWMYGYFAWKPYLVMKILKNLDYGDIIIHSDIGTLVVGDIKGFLAKFFETEDMFFFNEDIPMYRDCKKDLFYQLSVDYDKYKNYPLFRGCFWAIKKTKKTYSYLEKITENMLKIENVDQEVRIEDNPSDFVINHPGQSVPTLTLINLGFDFISYNIRKNKFMEENKDIELLIHVCRVPKKENIPLIAEKLNFNKFEIEELYNV
jgi:hypothetical protein